MSTREINLGILSEISTLQFSYITIKEITEGDDT